MKMKIRNEIKPSNRTKIVIQLKSILFQKKRYLWLWYLNVFFLKKRLN